MVGGGRRVVGGGVVWRLKPKSLTRKLVGENGLWVSGQARVAEIQATGKGCRSFDGPVEVWGHSPPRAPQGGARTCLVEHRSVVLRTARPVT